MEYTAAWIDRDANGFHSYYIVGSVVVGEVQRAWQGEGEGWFPRVDLPGLVTVEGEDVWAEKLKVVEPGINEVQMTMDGARAVVESAFRKWMQMLGGEELRS